VEASSQDRLEPTSAPNGWPWSLLRGFRDGDQAALTEVYSMHAEELARFLRRGFGFESEGRRHVFVGYQSPFELQDALHETFRRAFEPRARQAYDGVRPYGPYVRAIARNVVLRTFRARVALFPVVEGDGGDPATAAQIEASATAGPEHMLHREQVRELVARFLEGLDTQDRRLLELRFVDGRSQRDVAATLGIGRQRLRGREAKLRERLVRHLREHGELTLIPASVLPLVGMELCRVLAEALR
jgi:RNA polymerase sigma-70 factor (ECF subfamily)